MHPFVRAIAIAVTLAAAPTVAAADPPRDALLADLGLHVVGVGAQHAIAPQVAVEVTLAYYAPWTQLDHDGLAASDLVGAVARARVFVYLDAAPTGWWLSPFAQGGVGWGLRDGARHAGPVWAVGASVGYAWLFGRVQVAVGVGLQYHAADIPGGDAPPSFGGVWPHADALVGWTF